MIRKILTATAVAAVAMGVVANAAQADGNERFMKVMERGKLVVGVKADYKPWGFRDSNGNLVGMEIDMAKDVADALGVELELVPVQSSNRMQFLQQGKIDLMIATMSDRTDRRKIVGILEPNYYTSGTNVLAKKGAVKKWQDLGGKPVCGKQGAFYNKVVAKRYNAKIVAFVNNAEAKQALRDGKWHRLGVRRQLDRLRPRVGRMAGLRDAAELRRRQSLGPGGSGGRAERNLGQLHGRH